MDIVTHAIVGAITGAAFDRPVLGAIVGILPDSALWLRPRLAHPPTLYRAAHGALAPMFASTVCLALFGAQIALVVFCAWVSHIVLDIPTHGPEWSPRLFWPDERVVFDTHQEWEFFNASWWGGLALASLWSMIWLMISAVR